MFGMKMCTNRVQYLDEGVEHIFHVNGIPIVHQLGSVDEFESGQFLLDTTYFHDVLQLFAFLILHQIISN